MHSEYNSKFLLNNLVFMSGFMSILNLHTIFSSTQTSEIDGTRDPLLIVHIRSDRHQHVPTI